MDLTSNTQLCLFTTGIQDFANHLHKQLKKQDYNSVFSPISIYLFLVLICQDPWFDVSDFFKNYFHLDADVAVLHCKDIFAIFESLTNFSIKTASFLKRHSVLEDSFKKLLIDNFGTSAINVLRDTKGDAHKKTINTWISDKTLKKITIFESLNDSFRLLFLNTIHCKNDWSEPFAVENTESGTFHVNNHTVTTVLMMKKNGEFYFKDDIAIGAKVLKVPFSNSDLSFVMILPNSDKNIFEIERNFRDLAPQYAKDTTKQEVEVLFPKFKMEESLELLPLLNEIGLEEIFGANLSGLMKNEDLCINNIQQKLYLDLNEKDLEIATCTSSTLTTAYDEKPSTHGLVIYEASMSTEISNRFAKTDVVWRVNNNNRNAANAEFKVVLSETAFITDLVMEIDGKSYKSYVKEKEEARHIFNSAVARGHSAGLVEANTRDSKEFRVSVNLEPNSVAVFSLRYEEMLQRIHDQYELALNICLDQIVDELTIQVRINESRPLKFVKVLPLRSGSDIYSSKYSKCLDPLPDIKTVNSKTCTINFRPDPNKQKRMSHYLGRKSGEGLSGQFVVQYDVQRDHCIGEILLQDGHFVHFFASNDLDPLPKHVTFVLDTSGSMAGRKIEQLKDAMNHILDDLKKQDMISFIEFNTNVIVWDVNKKKCTMLFDNMIKDFTEPFASLDQYLIAEPQRVSDTIIKKTKEVVKDIKVHGKTFMIGALQTALYVVKMGQELKTNTVEKLQPIVIFLTDGEPTGWFSKTQIVQMVTNLNITDKVPIFTLSFGDQADKYFLRKLSLNNAGFSKHIYEAADASLQLQEFFKQISSPLLHNINFKYDTEVEEVTRTWFPIYFDGSELVVAGKCKQPTLKTIIDCWGPRTMIRVNSITETPVTSLERLWAYLTVKQLLDEIECSPNAVDLRRKAAINLALKYSFVTDVTSLVVVKPNETTPINTAGQHINESTFLPKTWRSVPPFGDSNSYSLFGSPAAQTFGAPQSHTFGATSSFGTTPATTTPSLFDFGYSQTTTTSTTTPTFTFGIPQTTVTTAPPFPSFSFGMPQYSTDCSSSSHSQSFTVDSTPRSTLISQEESNEKKKLVPTFTANHPFLFLIQLEREGNILSLLQGRVFRPVY